MTESTCPHKWDFKSYDTCPMCLKDMQSRHSPNYITTEMLYRIENLSYTSDLPSRYVRMMASEILSLREQLAQQQTAAKEKPNVEPYGWHVTGMSCLMRGGYAEHDAKAAAARCGGTTKAIPLYALPPTVQPLTPEQICEIAKPFVTVIGGHWENDYGIHERSVEDFARAIEKALIVGMNP